MNKLSKKTFILKTMRFNLIMSLIIILYLLLYPYFSKDIDTYLKNINPNLLKAFNIKELSLFTSFYSYTLSIMIIPYLVHFLNLGIQIFQEDSNNHYSDYFYTLPISRKEIIIKRIITSFIINILLLIITLLLISITIIFLKPDIFSTKTFLLINTNALLMIISFYIIGILLGSHLKYIKNPLMLSISIVLILYLLYFINNFLKIDIIKYINPIIYFNLSNISLNTYPYYNILIILVLLIISYIKSITYFDRKDLLS